MLILSSRLRLGFLNVLLVLDFPINMFCAFCFYCMRLSGDNGKWQGVVNAEMNVWFVWEAGNLLTFRHRASCILGQAFHYSPENVFYIFNQQIYFVI